MLSKPIARQNSPDLLWQLVRRDVSTRYKGSVFGVFWALLTPLFLLVLFTLVFGSLFRMRWPADVPGRQDSSDLLSFAVIMFAGLVAFTLFSDVMGRALSLILANKNYVTKVLFPLELLPMVVLGSALFQFLVAFGVLVVATIMAFGAIPTTIVAFPLVLFPFCIMILGLGYLLAALGVFFRDIGQIIANLLTGILFLSPIFYARSSLPDNFATGMLFNPVTIPVEQFRALLVFGQWPDLFMLTVYTAASLLVLAVGFGAFSLHRRGFADIV